MRGDQPITSKREDLLDRAGFANAVARTIRTIDASRGAVVAVMAPWGTGKTSLVNMVLETLHEAPALTTIEFNPWLFSGTDQLLLRFFGELATQIRLKAPTQQRVADLLLVYGQLISPLQLLPAAGPWIGRLRTVTSWVAGRLRGNTTTNSAEEQRRRLEAELRKRGTPLIVVIDDLDRLEAPEIRDVVRLVRLVGNFPQIIYLLAFDRTRVEQALERDGAGGRTYLEKIVEYTFDLPSPAPAAIERILLEAINDVTTPISGTLDPARWPDVFYRIVRPLVSSLRDVRRYVAVLPAAFASLGHEVEVIDVLALEAIRVLLPQVHAQLGELAPLLTDASRKATEESKARLMEFIDSGGSRKGAVDELCRLLFPVTQRDLGNQFFGPEWAPTWRRDRRVASQAVLDFYLIRTLAPGVAPARVVTQVFEALTDAARFNELLSGLENSVVEDLLSRLESYQERFRPDSADPATGVLIELYGRLQRPSQGPFDVNPDMKVDRLLLRLLQPLSDAERTRIVGSVIGRTTGYYGQLRLLDIVGYRRGVGNRLIPIEAWQGLHAKVVEEIRHLPSNVLANEVDPLRLILEAVEDNPSTRGELDSALKDRTLFLRILRKAATEVTVKPLGSLAVERTATLMWGQLLSAVGGQSVLQELVESVDDTNLEVGDRAVLDLAKKYLAGWRPAIPKSTVVLRSVMATNSPSNFLAPPRASVGAPDLVFRSVSIFDTQVSPPSVSGRAFHDHMTSELEMSRLSEQALSTFGSLSGESASAAWVPDADIQQTRQVAVSRIHLRASNGAEVVGRFALLESGSATRAVADLCIWYPTLAEANSPEEESDPSRRPVKPLTLGHAVAILASTVEAVAGQLGLAILPTVFGGQWSKNPVVELHLVPRPGTDTNRPQYSLPDVIDFAGLGTPSSHPPYEGHAGLELDELVRDEHQAREIVIDELRRLTADWGYLDADPGLNSL